MKKIIIVMLSLTLAITASAQRVSHGGGRISHVPVTRVYISPYSYGFGYGFPYFGYPYYGYGAFGYPPYGYGYPSNYRRMPYQLNMQIETIKSDYQNQIKAARKDKTVSHAQRRKNIRALKDQRDKDIVTAKMDYIHSSMNQRRGMNQMNRNRQNNNNNPNDQNNKDNQNNQNNNQGPDNDSSSGNSNS
ncbi:MAG TPA: hypothetical protein VN726_04710 [Hanamia sp.]|nr:hypothetical protein [Hanamia sp.]